MNILTILLGLSVGAIMSAEAFLKPESLLVFALGVTAFAASTAFGVSLAKLMNLFTKEKINPMIGAAGVSVTPEAYSRLPNINMPMRGADLGTSRIIITAAIKGNRIFSVLDTSLSWGFMYIARSFWVVSNFITGGWIIGTSAI
ncbi:hypothetical protein ES708_29272 [subsurface metagenome]